MLFPPLIASLIITKTQPADIVEIQVGDIDLFFEIFHRFGKKGLDCRPQSRMDGACDEHVLFNVLAFGFRDRLVDVSDTGIYIRKQLFEVLKWDWRSGECGAEFPPRRVLRSLLGDFDSNTSEESKNVFEE